MIENILRELEKFMAEVREFMNKKTDEVVKPEVAPTDEKSS